MTTTLTYQYIQENGLESLTEDLGIMVKHYEDSNLVCLKYSQIDSPKTHPVVRECRGLVLDRDNYSVLCRPFQRFYNYGEAPETTLGFNIDRAICYEKIDGSLIKVWFDYRYGTWHCGTSGTAFAESEVNGFGLTFSELVYKALGVSDYHGFHRLCCKSLSEDITYLFEITSMENRVVTRYEGTTLWFLGAIENNSFKDLTYKDDVKEQVSKLRVSFPMEYHFDSLEDCVAMAANLPNLEEGYVVYDPLTDIRIKIKSPAYVAVHHIRGEGLNPKRIKQLVLTNEQDEYLQYYPEDKKFIEPYVTVLEDLILEMEETYSKVCNIENQKEFALQVKDKAYSSVLFQARAKGLTASEQWSSMDSKMKYKVFSNFIEEDV